MAGIKLTHGGTYTNTGKVVGDYSYGVEIYGGIGHVINSGEIYCQERGTAVILENGGSVTNSGSISSDMAAKHGFGLRISGGGGTVTNSGLISGDFMYGGGVSLTGGTVTNLAGGVISGGHGVSFYSASGVVSNFGKVLGQSVYPAIRMEAGGAVRNYAAGQISGFYGIEIAGGAGNVTNAGVISGVELDLGGTVNNRAGANITQGHTGEFQVYCGVYIKGAAGSVTNAGAISGSTAAIKFAGGGANSLILQSGSVLNGSAIGSTTKGAINVLQLTGSGVANNAFLNFQKLSVLAGGAWTLAGAATIGSTKVFTGGFGIAGALTTAIRAAVATSVTVTKNGALHLKGASQLSGTMNDKGMLTESGGPMTLGDASGDKATLSIAVTGTWDITDNSGVALGKSKHSSIANLGLLEKTGGAGVSVIAPTLANGGHVLVASGTLDFQGAVMGTGADTIAGAATLEFESTVASAQTIDFTGAGGVLDLGAPPAFAGAISGFDSVGSNDSVELLGSWSISGFSTSSTQSTLTLSNGAQAASLLFNGNYSQSLFHQAISSGHTTITYG